MKKKIVVFSFVFASATLSMLSTNSVNGQGMAPEELGGDSGYVYDDWCMYTDSHGNSKIGGKCAGAGGVCGVQTSCG